MLKFLKRVTKSAVKTPCGFFLQKYIRMERVVKGGLRKREKSGAATDRKANAFHTDSLFASHPTPLFPLLIVIINENFCNEKPRQHRGHRRWLGTPWKQERLR
jgi:hypothetical protein